MECLIPAPKDNFKLPAIRVLAKTGIILTCILCTRMFRKTRKLCMAILILLFKDIILADYDVLKKLSKATYLNELQTDAEDETPKRTKGLFLYFLNINSLLIM